MHCRPFIRLLVLFAMLVSLPLNGLAAITMPACDAHGTAMKMHMDAEQMAAMPDCDHHEPEAPSGKTACDQCFSCHVVSAQALVPIILSLPEMAIALKFSAAIAEKPQSVVSSLFRPPISVLA
jgi:hypothetical protein